MQHFFNTLYNGTSIKAGYEIYHAHDLQGMGRVIDPNQMELGEIVSREFDGQIKKLEFKDFLYVYYKPEKESANYKAHMYGTLKIGKVDDKSTRRSQNSWIKMREENGFIEFETNGYIRNPMEFYSYGYWGYEKIGDMMPINYVPSNSDKK